MAHLDDRMAAGAADAAALETAVSDGPDGVDRGGLLGGTDLEAVAAPARALVRERPFVALAGAILAGFLISRILARR